MQSHPRPQGNVSLMNLPDPHGTAYLLPCIAGHNDICARLTRQTLAIPRAAITPEVFSPYPNGSIHYVLRLASVQHILERGGKSPWAALGAVLVLAWLLSGRFPAIAPERAKVPVYGALIRTSSEGSACGEAF